MQNLLMLAASLTASFMLIGSSVLAFRIGRATERRAQRRDEARRDEWRGSAVRNGWVPDARLDTVPVEKLFTVRDVGEMEQ